MNTIFIIWAVALEMHTPRVTKRKYSFYILEVCTKILNQVGIRFYDLNSLLVSWSVILCTLGAEHW